MQSRKELLSITRCGPKTRGEMDQSNSTAGRVRAPNTADLGSDRSTTYSFPSTSGVFPQRHTEPVHCEHSQV